MNSWRGIGFLVEVFNIIRLMNKIGIKPLGIPDRFIFSSFPFKRNTTFFLIFFLISNSLADSFKHICPMAGLC